MSGSGNNHPRGGSGDRDDLREQRRHSQQGGRRDHPDNRPNEPPRQPREGPGPRGRAGGHVGNPNEDDYDSYRVPRRVHHRAPDEDQRGRSSADAGAGYSSTAGGEGYARHQRAAAASMDPRRDHGPYYQTGGHGHYERPHEGGRPNAMPPSPSPSQALYDPRRRPLPRDFERPSYVPYGGGGGGGATAGSRDQYSGGVQQGYSRSEHGRDSRERGGWPTQGRVGGDRAPAGHMGGGPGRGFAGRAPPMRGHRGADLATIEHVTTNSFPAVLTPNFGFYQVSITIQDPQGKEVDSRFVKRIIFRKAMLDHHLRHLPPEPKWDAYRSYFFVGSYFFAIRNDPPFRTDEKMYRGPEGSLRIGKVQHYTAPLSLVAPQAPVPGTTRLGEVVVDAHRCSHCTRTFSTTQALLAHCANTGHQPVTSPFPVGTADHVPPSRPATMEVLAAYANCILQATLNGDPKLKKWGREHVDLESKTEPTDRNRRPLGIELYKAYSASFSVAAVPPSKDVSGPMRDRSKSGGGRPKSEWRGDADIGSVAHGDDNATAKLILTVDLKAKIMRTRTLLQILCGDRDPDRVTFSPEHQEWAKREWEGKTIIHRHEKRCYTVHQLIFEDSARTLPIRDKSMSHEDYYKNVKGMELRHPTATPMVAVLGRRDEVIHLPAEIVTSNDLEPAVREKLPQIASYLPKTRYDEIERFKKYVTPGTANRRDRENGMNLLPAAGIVLSENAMVVPARVLSVPALMAAGVNLTSANSENWGNALNRACYRVNPQEQTEMHAVVFYHSSITREGAMKTFEVIRSRANAFQTKFRLAEKPYHMVETSPAQRDRSHHCEELERFLSAKHASKNLFFMQFVKPVNGNVDPDYSPVKYMLLRCGWLTQFVNFAKYDHARSGDPKSRIVLQGVARQVLQKCGARLWWTSIPRSLPLPALFVGIDVSHAPKVFDPDQRGFMRKKSCAAIVTVVVRGGPSDTIEMFSTTSTKYPGQEACLEYDLKENIEGTIRACNVEPKCVIGWRDGISDTAFEELAAEEVRGIRAALAATEDPGSKRKKRYDDVPVAYVICQKSVNNKFLCLKDGAVHSAPSGTLVSSICGWDKDHDRTLETFFINGRAPPFSTAKPVRFVVYERDELLSNVPLPELTWGQCHEYANWTGAIKQPAVTKMAHKLSKLAGTFADCGESIDHEGLANRAYFL